MVSLSPRRDEYDYWFDPAAHAGEDAILLGDRWRPLTAAIRAQFASVIELKSLRVVQRGQRVDTQRIYLATGYRPDG